MTEELTPDEVLRATKELLLTKGWTRHQYSRDKKDKIVYPTLAAEQFCLVGAIRALTGAGLKEELPDCASSALLRLREALRARNAKDSVFFFNDNTARSVHDVTDLIDEALNDDGRANSPTT